MKIQKLGKFILVYGICNLINAVLSLGYYFVVESVMVTGNYSMMNLCSLVNFILEGLCSLGGIISILVGFSQKYLKMDTEIQKLRKLIILLVIVRIISIGWGFIYPLFYSLLSIDFEIYRLTQNIGIIVSYVPALIFSVFFLIWGYHLQQEREIKNLVAFVGITLFTIMGVFFLILNSDGIHMNDPSSLRSYYAESVIQILLYCCWVIVAFQIPKMGTKSGSKAPIFQSNLSNLSYSSFGQQMLSDKDVFCVYCGIPQQNPQAKFCKTCGKKFR